jgi:hypothetical protein
VARSSAVSAAIAAASRCAFAAKDGSSSTRRSAFAIASGFAFGFSRRPVR